jgi:anti-sigma factor RsiW
MKQEHPSIDQLVDYGRGELSPRDDATIHAHLTTCAACAEAYDAETRLVELLRRRAGAEERELPPGFADAILARAAADTASPAFWSWNRLEDLLRPAVAVPVAAAIAVAIYVSASGWHGSAKNDAVDAAYYIENHAALASTTPFEESAVPPTMLTSDENPNQ